jgi:hypothetical protein
LTAFGRRLLVERTREEHLSVAQAAATAGASRAIA